MKIFLLIHEQDTDAACGSDVKPFTDKRAALDAMQKGWVKTVSAWAYASKEHDGEDEYECECRGNTAVIRSGGDVEHWRIEEHDLAVSVSVAVEVSGGLVQCVYAKGGDVDADVFDLDASDSTDEGEQDEARAREKALSELINSPGWQCVW
ncbi:MAG: hypothetical protein K2M15_04190 [Oscillospiraceae bacterium]|nr:hypothetical protein [Oscillospiraceae bacterium]MDE7170267.1 hypothetical protein [Oscillospiraceae bacterium]